MFFIFICRPSFTRFSVFRFFGFSVFRFFSAAFRLSAGKGKRWRDAVASIWVSLIDTPTLQVSYVFGYDLRLMKVDGDGDGDVQIHWRLFFWSKLTTTTMLGWQCTILNFVPSTIACRLTAAARWAELITRGRTDLLDFETCWRRSTMPWWQRDVPLWNRFTRSKMMNILRFPLFLQCCEFFCFHWLGNRSKVHLRRWLSDIEGKI